MHVHIHDGFLKTAAGVPGLSWAPGLSQVACSPLHIWACTAKIPAAFQQRLHFYGVQIKQIPIWTNRPFG